MSSCSIRFCTNRSSRNPELRFFRYPKDEETLDKWLLHSRSRINLRNARVCSVHFDSSAFRNDAEGLRRPLKPDAAPTLFVANDEELDYETQDAPTNPEVLQPNTDSSFGDQKNHVLSKLGTLIQSTKYCSLCLRTEDLRLLDSLTEDCHLNKMLLEVFGENMSSLLSSDWICEECKTNTINTYNFLQQTKTRATILNEFIDDLNEKVDEMNRNEFENIENVVLTPTMRQRNKKLDRTENIKMMAERFQETGEEFEGNDYQMDDFNVENETESEIEFRNEFENIENVVLTPTLRQGNKKLERTENIKMMAERFQETGEEFEGNDYQMDDFNDENETESEIEFRNEFENIENVVLTPTLRQRNKKLDRTENIKMMAERFQETGEEFEGNDYQMDDFNVENETDFEIEFTCDDCGFKGETKNILEKHMRSHNNRCPDCNLFLRKDRPHTRCKYGCSDCDKRPCVHEEYLISFFEQKDAGRTKIKCPDCRYYTVLKKCDFIEHVNRDHIKSFKHLCDVCSQAFYSKRSLTNHKYLFHTECYTCGYCDLDFRNKNVLAIHIIQCEKDIRAFGCDKCSATFDEKDKVTAHIKKRHDLIYFCDECLFKCNSLKSLKIHTQATHGGKVLSRRKNALSCTVCHKIFSEHKDFRLHMRKHPKSDKHVSRCCGREFQTRAKCIIHESNRHFKYDKCTQCFKYVKSSKYQDHIKTHGENYLCESCGKNFNSEIHLKLHKKTHDEPIPCSICNKMMKNSSLKAHLLRHQAEKDPDLAFQLKQRSRYSCKNCDYSTPNVKYLQAHVNRHHLKIKPYSCDICSKEFTADFLLQFHKSSHEKQKVFPCETCQKSFGAHLGLQLHIRREHSGEKPYKCNICQQCFISSSLLSSHKRITHIGKTVACPLCQTLFHDYARVRMHIKRVHWKGGNKFDLREIEGLTEEHLMLLEDRRKSLYFTKDDAVM